MFFRKFLHSFLHKYIDVWLKALNNNIVVEGKGWIVCHSLGLIFLKCLCPLAIGPKNSLYCVAHFETIFSYEAPFEANLNSWVCFYIFLLGTKGKILAPGKSVVCVEYE